MLNIILLAAREGIFLAIGQHGPNKETVIVHVARRFVDVVGEGAPKKIFWCTIPQRPGYDARDLARSTASTKIPNYSRQSTLPHKEKYIVWLHITMNQPTGMQSSYAISGV
jgi:hypothetical protein